MAVLEPASVSASEIRSVGDVVEIAGGGHDSPAARSPSVLAMQEETRLLRTLMGGTSAMRAAGVTYLPQHPLEEASAWIARRDGSFLFSGLELAVESLVASGFRRGIVVGKDVPEAIVGWLDNVDREGNELDLFAKDILKSGIVNGVTAIIADSPVVPEGTNAKQEEELQIRPYLTHVPLESWRGVLVESLFGRLRIKRFWWSEKSERAKGAFGVEMVERIRVLRAGDPTREEGDLGRLATVEIWERVDDGKAKDDASQMWRLDGPARPLAGFTDVPIVLFFTERTGFATADPPMRAISDKNLEHWQSASDQRNILHVARVPLLFVSGTSAEQVKELAAGASTFYASNEPSARMMFVEHGGAAIAAGERDLEKIKEEMAVLAMRPMIDRPTGTETATAKAIDTARANSRLSAWMMALESALEGALDMAAKFGGIDVGDGVSLDANKEFGLSVATIENMRSLLLARAQGDVSRQTLLEVFHKVFRDVLSPEWEVDEELRRLSREAAGEEVELSDRILEEVGRGEEEEEAREDVEEEGTGEAEE